MIETNRHQRADQGHFQVDLSSNQSLCASYLLTERSPRLGEPLMERVRVLRKLLSQFVIFFLPLSLFTEFNVTLLEGKWKDGKGGGGRWRWEREKKFNQVYK